MGPLRGDLTGEVWMNGHGTGRPGGRGRRGTGAALTLVDTGGLGGIRSILMGADGITSEAGAQVLGERGGQLLSQRLGTIFATLVKAGVGKNINMRKMRGVGGVERRGRCAG